MDNALVSRGFAGHAFLTTVDSLADKIDALCFRAKLAGFLKKIICNGGTRTIGKTSVYIQDLHQAFPFHIQQRLYGSC
jgi:hypothetical protein